MVGSARQSLPLRQAALPDRRTLQLFASQGQSERGWALLEQVYKGFDTADLRAAERFRQSELEHREQLSRYRVENVIPFALSARTKETHRRIPGTIRAIE
jgi:hypothetical protein